jgi:hypothetical protein
MTPSGPDGVRNPAVQRGPDLILAATLCCQECWLGQRMQIGQLKRREFITLLGGAAAALAVARAQQIALPVIGYLDSRTPEAVAGRLRAFRQGLKETGYSKARMSQSSIDGLKIKSIGCQNLPAIWLHATSQ